MYVCATHLKFIAYYVLYCNWPIRDLTFFRLVHDWPIRNLTSDWFRTNLSEIWLFRLVHTQIYRFRLKMLLMIVRFCYIRYFICCFIIYYFSFILLISIVQFSLETKFIQRPLQRLPFWFQFFIFIKFNKLCCIRKMSFFRVDLKYIFLFSPIFVYHLILCLMKQSWLTIRFYILLVVSVNYLSIWSGEVICTSC